MIDSPGRSLRQIAAVVTVTLLSSCVTVYEDAPLLEDNLEIPEFAVSQTIPLGKPPVSQEEVALMQLYDGILRRMQEAVDDRDVAVLFNLLDSYQKPGLPEWLSDRLAGYRAVGHGLQFLEHAAASATLKLVPAAVADGDVAADAAAGTAPPPTIGAPLRVEFALPPMMRPIHLGGAGDDDPIAFVLAITYEDTYVDGNRKSHRRHEPEVLPAAVELVGDQPLVLPFELTVEAGEAVRRVVHFRIDILHGFVRDGEVRAPIRRRALAALSVTQWPAGYEPIAAKPLATLREALRLGDRQHFPHVFLAGMFAKGPDRQAAITRLIDEIRYAPESRAMVAMATLREMTGANVPKGDREAWLAWWNTRR
ncbi:MAG: hypothetical protein NXI31_18675 [bacterium]|nr:hypothetical protein [bacterium]